MSVDSTSRVRLALLTVLAATLMLAFPQPALAQGIVYGQSIPSGVVVENDVLLAGETVTIDGTVLGDVVAVGTTVRINGQIRGSLITAAQTIVINGSVGGTLYSAAADLLLGPTADIQRNLYYAGLSMTAQRGSRIERDLLGVTFGATLGGSIGRETRAVIGPLEIARLIISLAKWDVKIPILTSPTSSIPAPAIAALSHSLTLTASTSRVQAAAQRGELRTAGPSVPIDLAPVWPWLLQELRVLASLVVMALLVGWLLPSFTAGASERVRAKPLLALGYGLIALVIAFNLIGVALLVGVLILAIGLSLGYASLWHLTFLFWGVGFSALGLAVFILAAFVLYGSRMIMAYLAGNLILSRWPNLARHRWLPLLVGLIPYLLVTSIPWIGWILDILLMSVGLGAAWLAIRSKRKVSAPPTVELPSQPEPPGPQEAEPPSRARRKAARIAGGCGHVVDRGVVPQPVAGPVVVVALRKWTTRDKAAKSMFERYKRIRPFDRSGADRRHSGHERRPGRASRQARHSCAQVTPCGRDVQFVESVKGFRQGTRSPDRGEGLSSAGSDPWSGPRPEPGLPPPTRDSCRRVSSA